MAQQPREPPLDEVLHMIRNNPATIPSFYLLDPSNRFVNEERYTFLQSGYGYLREMFQVFLSDLKFMTAPAELTQHFFAPNEGPVAIAVGGMAMSVLDGISVPSTDIDIDLLPLLEKTYTEGSPKKLSSIAHLPAYTSERTLTPEYQKYFDWLQKRVITILESHFSGGGPGFTPMTQENIQENVEVSMAKKIDRVSGYSVGSVRSIQLTRNQNFVVAQIVNPNFYSKVAIWVRVGDSLERIVEFKLLQEPPVLDAFVPITEADRTIAKPKRTKYIESAIQTLDHRINMLQIDSNVYNGIMRGLCLFPDTHFLKREEYLRKKLLLTKMRIDDLFQRILELFSGIPVSEQSAVLFIKYVLIFNNKQTENFTNPYMAQRIQELQFSIFSGASAYGLPTLIINFGKKRAEVTAAFEAAKNDTSQMIEPLKPTFDEELAGAKAMLEKYRMAEQERRAALFAPQKVHEELALTIESARSESPTSADDTEEEVAAAAADEDNKNAQANAEEVFSALQTLEKNTSEEEAAKKQAELQAILEKQQEKERKRQERIEAAREKGRLESLAAKQKKKEAQRKKAENLRVLNEFIKLAEGEKATVEEAKAAAEELKKKRAEARAARKLIVIYESSSLYPEQMYHTIMNTVYPTVYPGEDDKSKIVFGFRLSDYIALDRPQLRILNKFTPPMYPPNFRMYRENKISGDFQICNEIILPNLMSTYSTLPVSKILDNLITSLSLLLTITTNIYEDETKAKLDVLQAMLGEYTGAGKRQEKVYLEELTTHYTETLLLCANIVQVLYESMASMDKKNEFLPSFPTDMDFHKAYDGLFQKKLTIRSRDEQLERQLFMNSMMLFYKDMLTTFTTHLVNDIYIEKTKVIGPDIPLVVIISYPNNYRNELDYSEGVPVNNFSFAYEFYMKLQESFVFYESYPLTQEYLKLVPSFQDDIDRIIQSLTTEEDGRKQKYWQIQHLWPKQITEMNLYLSQHIWRTTKFIRRYDVILNMIVEKVYVLNSVLEWDELNDSLNDMSLKIEDLQAITIIRVGKYKQLYMDLFLNSKERKERLRDLTLQFKQAAEEELAHTKKAKRQAELREKIEQQEAQAQGLLTSITRQKLPFPAAFAYFKKTALKQIEEFKADRKANPNAALTIQRRLGGGRRRHRLTKKKAAKGKAKRKARAHRK